MVGGNDMIPQNKFLVISAFVAALLLSFGITQNVHAAFGVSPPFVNADKLVKGAVFQQTIYLVRDIADVDLPIQATLDIPEKVRPWINLDNGLDFIIPKDVRQFPVKISIKVPQETDLAAYQGKLVFTGKPSQSGQVTIALGAQVSLNIVVGNDVYRKLDIRVLKNTDIEEGWNPQLYVKADNQGNVPESFTGATMEVLDQYGAVRLAFMQSPKNMAEIPPFTVSEQVIEFPTDFHLGLGQYWGVANLYQNDKLIASQKSVFNVLKKGSLSKPSLAAFFGMVMQYKTYVVIGLILLALIAFGVFRLRRK
jgi:hypothetical protein